MNLYKPLTVIFNASLEQNTFPAIWKKSSITPIYKSGNRYMAQNYRPISKLCIFSKIFEKLIYGEILFDVKNLIIDQQHGFFPERCLDSNLLCFSDFVSDAIDRNIQVDAVYTDFSKAFDRVNHNLLLSKLIEVGVRSSLVKWVSSYLHNREFFVSINGHKSHLVTPSSGVPQGSHLGPLFFVIFINDIAGCFNHSQFLLYADDLKLYKTIENLTDCKKMQCDLNMLTDYCTRNDLLLNITKCYSITFTKKKNIIPYTYQINNININSVSEIRDLGVTLDSKWSFNTHIDKTLNNSNKMLGFIRRYSKHFNNPATLLSLYYAFIHSNLSFASIIWSPQYDVHINRIESVQHKFLKILAYKSGIAIDNHDYSAVMEYFKILPLAKRRVISDICYLHKILNSGIDCPYLLSKVNINVPTRANPRHCMYFNIPFCRTNIGLNSPLIRMQRNLNTYGKYADMFTHQLSAFKRQIKNTMLATYRN
nr:unnamed protein product [Callosobruchus chinensis]